MRPLHVPEWDLTDRLRKTLRDAGLTTSDMADYLGVSRNTIGSWTGGKITPGIASLRAWAMACGVPFEWLKDGQEFETVESVRRQGLEPRTRWLLATRRRQHRAPLRLVVNRQPARHLEAVA